MLQKINNSNFSKFYNTIQLLLDGIHLLYIVGKWTTPSINFEIVSYTDMLVKIIFL